MNRWLPLVKRFTSHSAPYDAPGHRPGTLYGFHTAARFVPSEASRYQPRGCSPPEARECKNFRHAKVLSAERLPTHIHCNSKGYGKGNGFAGGFSAQNRVRNSDRMPGPVAAPNRVPKRYQRVTSCLFLPQTRSITIAIPCPTPIHMVHNA